MTTDAIVAECRVVFDAGDDEGPVAHVFPVDANAYSRPIGVVRLRRDQELPRTPFGDLARCEGILKRGERITLVFADGTRVVPAGPLEEPWSRIFAQRGQEVLLHPAVTGERPSWRHGRTLARHNQVAWAQAWERKRRENILTMAAGVVAIVLGVASFATPVRWPKLAALGVSGVVAGLQGLKTATAKLAAGRAARAALGRPVRAMHLRLWWAASPNGPVAMASLALPESPEQPVAHLEVLNVPAGYDPPSWTAVQVVGEVDEGAAPLIRDGEVELWPASVVRRLGTEP